jgi:hypothetical protein
VWWVVQIGVPSALKALVVCDADLDRVEAEPASAVVALHPHRRFAVGDDAKHVLLVAERADEEGADVCACLAVVCLFSEGERLGFCCLAGT